MSSLPLLATGAGPRRQFVHLPLIVGLLLLTGGCGGAEPAAIPTSPRGTVMHSAAGPIVIPISDQIDGVNPCTGLPHTLTATGTLTITQGNGAQVINVRLAVTTSDGFQGGQQNVLVDNGSVFKVSVNGMLTNSAGDRIRVNALLLIDLSTGEERLFNGIVTCVSP